MTDWKEILTKQLKQIGWSLTGVGCDYYRLVDHLNEMTHLEFKADCITVTGSSSVGIHFYLKDCEFETHDKDALCIKSKTDGSVFMNLYSFGRL